MLTAQEKEGTGGAEERIGGFKKVREKMGLVVEIETGKISISEFNTRCRFVDEAQVKRLKTSMEENGFIPKCAVWVNAVTEDGSLAGTVLQYRLVAGRHRHEAASRVGLERIPCQIFYNLEPEEECELDRLDNELDETHKPVHFLEEAEHYRYLQEVKGWSQRQIAKAKGVPRGTVIRKLQIASMPEEAKEIVRSGSHGIHFAERHFRDICRLSDPHIVAVCREIADRGAQADRGETDPDGRPVQPMRQSEIRARVEELLALEEEGKVDPSVMELLQAQGEHPEEKKEPEAPGEEAEVSAIGEAIAEIMAGVKPLEAKPPAEKLAKPEPQAIPALPIDWAYRSPKKDSKGMSLDRCVRWMKLAGLVQSLGQTIYIVLRKMEEYDFWFRANEDKPFFLDDRAYGDPFALIAEESGVEKEHVQKRALPELKRKGFIDYWIEKGQYHFKFNWDRLFQVYCDVAYAIPFSEEGLKDIPEGYTGIRRPTPFHYIRVVNGNVISWEKGKVEASAPAGDDLAGTLKAFEISDDLAGRWLRRYSSEYIREKMEIMEFKKAQGEDIRNPGGMLRRALEEDWERPAGFLTRAEREEAERRSQEEKAQAAREALDYEERERRRREMADAAEEWRKTAGPEILAQIHEEARQAVMVENEGADERFLGIPIRLRENRIIIERHLGKR